MHWTLWIEIGLLAITFLAVYLLPRAGARGGLYRPTEP